MSKQIEFIHNANTHGAAHSTKVSPNVMMSISTSSPFRPEPVSEATKTASGEDNTAVTAFAVAPNAMTMRLHTAYGSLPGATWTTLRTIPGHVQMRTSENGTDSSSSTTSVDARLSSLVANRERFEVIGMAIGICGALFLLLMTITMHVPLATVVPGAVLLLSLSGFMLLRRRLRKGAGQDG